jgi:hypothetical protein
VRVRSPKYHGDIESLPKPIQISQVLTKDTPKLLADITTGKAARTIVVGKLINWDSKPVGGVKIVATKKRPVDRYKKFEEVITKNNGTFHLSNLLADSSYILRPVSDKWDCETSVRVNSPKHQGEKITLTKPMVIERAFVKNGCSLVGDLTSSVMRFSISSEGVISDSQTGLEWIEGPDEDIHYSKAEQWVGNCRVAGGGWRIPTTKELKTLSQPGVERCVGHKKRKFGEKVDLDPAFFKTKAPFVWALSNTTSKQYRQFNFNQNREWKSSGRAFLMRVFGVRPRR